MKNMLTWPALLISPLIALGNLVIIYALVTPSCAMQHESWLQITIIASLLLSLLLTLMAGYAWLVVKKKVNLEPDSARFIAILSVLSGVFFTLVLATQWVGQWILSPCS